jgi:hypothetical protein
VGAGYKLPRVLGRGLEDPEVPLENLVDDITRPVKPGDRNNMALLLGKVGTGKSSLVSHLIVRDGFQWLEDRLLAVRVDLDYHLKHTLPVTKLNKVQLLYPVYDLIHKAYLEVGLVDDKARDAATAECHFERNLVGFKTPQAERAVRDLYKRLFESSGGYRLLLMIDNIDFLYHRYDRGLFIKEAEGNSSNWTKAQTSAAEERERAFRLVQYLVSCFFDDEALGMLGANVLLVLRSDSLRHYLAGKADEGEMNGLMESTYRIIPAAAGEVVAAHLNLLRSVVRAWPVEGTVKHYEEAVEHLEVGPHGVRKQLHDQICGLSRQSYRQVMKHYGDYVWLPIGFEKEERLEVTTRFHEQLTPGLVAFIQNGKRRFSQYGSEFPNIYLVRGEWAEQIEQVWENLCIPHDHTYWLKRLVIELVAQTAGNIAPKKIYEIFSGSAEDGLYEDHIVRLCLGSLAQVEKCHLVDFTFATRNREDAPWVVSEINLSERGQFFMGVGNLKETPFVDSFTYLQVVVDDYVMPLPRSVVADEFAWKDHLDYGYLAAPRREYAHAVINMLALKVRQVWVFLDVLRIALACEKVRYHRVFENLAGLGIRIPDVDEITKHVTDDLLRIENGLNRDDKLVFDHRHLVPSTKTREGYMARMEQELRQVYQIPADQRLTSEGEVHPGSALAVPAI